MQTLAVQLTTTLVDDAIELAKGLPRILIHLALAPIERIANACDVAGVLEERRARRLARRNVQQRRRRRGLFGSLNQLT